MSLLGKLYVRPYPDFLIAPWEDAEGVNKEAPDISRTQTIRAKDGTVLIERAGEPGLVDVVEVMA
jgi:hypothetical protein